MQTQIEILPCIVCGQFKWSFRTNSREKNCFIKCDCGHRGPEISQLNTEGKFRNGEGEQMRREAIEAWNREREGNKHETTR